MTRNLDVKTHGLHWLNHLPVLLLVALFVLSMAVKTVGQANRPRRAEELPKNPTREPNPSQPETLDVIKIDSNLVNVPVIVSDREGRYVPNLPVTSFRLFDNDSQQPIVHFEAAEEPLNVALLLDTSHSTQGSIDDIKDAAKKFLKDLRPQDRALIISFDYEIHRLCGLTNDRKRLEKAIKEAKVGKFAGTVLNDTIEQVVNQDLKSVTGRKAIVLLSDGEDHGSETPADLLLDEQKESDAMVYSIYYKPLRLTNQRMNGRFGGIFGGRDPRLGPGRRFGRRGMEFLEDLSETTSGRFYSSEITDLTKTFSLIAEELRHQYKLGFYPPEMMKDGAIHQLRVKVQLDGVAVRARQQYRAQQ